MGLEMGEGSPKSGRGGVLNDSKCNVFKSLYHFIVSCGGPRDILCLSLPQQSSHITAGWGGRAMAHIFAPFPAERGGGWRLHSLYLCQLQCARG